MALPERLSYTGLVPRQTGYFMEAPRAIELVQRQRRAIPGLRSRSHHGPEFAKWKRDTTVALSNIFGENTSQVSAFRSVSYISSVSFTGDERESHDVYVNGLGKADAILESIIDEIRDFPATLPSASPELPDVLPLIEQICLNFQTAGQVLQDRARNRPSLEINDEYDVQDLLHAFLRLHFEDIRPEEFTPSHAGGNSRVDFLLKKERVMIEIKKTRSGLGAKELGEQLIIDCARYERHPDCETLVCFVYDPDKRILNRAAIRDVERHSGKLKVRVIIAPK